MQRLIASAVVLVVLSTSVLVAQSPWTQQTSNTTQILRGLSVVSADVVWTSGVLGVVLRTTDGGASWTTCTTPGAAYDIYEIEALDANTAWAFGTDDATQVGVKIWKTTNGGTSWTEQYANANTFGDGIRFFDANNGIAYGDPVPGALSVMVILRTTDGGTTWNQVPSTNIPPALEASSEMGVVNGLDLTGSTAWFVTYAGSTSFLPRVFKSTDMGQNWTASAHINIDDSYGFSMCDENKGIISNINSGSIARTTNGWTTVDSTQLLFAGAYGLRSVEWITGTNSIVVVGGPTSTGISGTSVDGGVTWTQQTVPAGIGRLRAVQFKSPSIGWAVGNSGAILKWTGPAITAVDEHGGDVPSAFALDQNFPNPFNPSTTIRFVVPRQSFVTLKVLDLLGRTVATLEEGTRNAGEHIVTFNASSLPSGLYVYSITADGYSAARKMMLLK